MIAYEQYCRKCGSNNLGHKRGHAPNGKARRDCNGCGRNIVPGEREAIGFVYSNPEFIDGNRRFAAMEHCGEVNDNGACDWEAHISALAAQNSLIEGNGRRLPRDNYVGTSDKGGGDTPACDSWGSSLVYVVSSAQNGAPADEAFFTTLRFYAAKRNAKLAVIKTRYKNPDAFHGGGLEPDDFDPILDGYLIDDDMPITADLIVAGRLRVNATAASPLQGLDDVHGTRSAIYGHAQLQMRMIPTPNGEMPKMVRTTGAVTEPQFSSSKAGQKADFHHSKAAIVIEVLGCGNFISRELSWSDEWQCFQDLDTRYFPDGRTELAAVDALILGDEHVEFRNEAVFDATFGAGGIVDVLLPGVLIRHDMHDHFSASHHHEQDPVLKAVKARDGKDDVEAELNKTVDALKLTGWLGLKSVVVDSNHHDHLGKWLASYDAKKDPKNAIIAWELFGMMSKALRAGETPNPFALFIKDRLAAEGLEETVEFADANKPIIIRDIDVSQHGHIGPNGSRGGPRSFGSSARKMITGHTHTPGIERGVWTVGTSVPTMPYARGYGSWMTTHCVIYPTGKRALIHIVNGKWRL